MRCAATRRAAPGEPDSVRRARTGPRSGTGTGRHDASRKDGFPPTRPFMKSAVQISCTSSAWNRPNASGGCPRPGGQLAGLQPPLDGGSDGTAPGRPGSGGPGSGAGRVLHLQPGCQLLGPVPQPGRTRRGDGTSASNPPSRRATTHRSIVRRDTLTLLPSGSGLAGRQVPHDRAALARCQGRVHRGLCQRPPPQRDGVPPLPGGGRLPVLLSSHVSREARFMTGCPDHGPPGTITRPR